MEGMDGGNKGQNNAKQRKAGQHYLCLQYAQLQCPADGCSSLAGKSWSVVRFNIPTLTFSDDVTSQEINRGLKM